MTTGTVFKADDLASTGGGGSASSAVRVFGRRGVCEQCANRGVCFRAIADGSNANSVRTGYVVRAIADGSNANSVRTVVYVVPYQMVSAP